MIKNFLKTLKYWHQSTGYTMANNQTKHPASGLKQKPSSKDNVVSTCEVH